MSKNEIDEIIADVFAETGVKLTADDPIVAVLLLQRQTITGEIAAFEQRQQKQQDTFLQQLAIHEHNITRAAEELQTYRQQILTELLQKVDSQQEEVEARLFSSINQRVSKHTEQQQNAFLGRLKGYLTVACAVWLLVAVLMVMLK